jgi:hypothetical protein
MRPPILHPYTLSCLFLYKNEASHVPVSMQEQSIVVVQEHPLCPLVVQGHPRCSPVRRYPHWLAQVRLWLFYNYNHYNTTGECVIRSVKQTLEPVVVVPERQITSIES